MMTEEQLIDRIFLTCVDVRHSATDESAQKFINDIRGLAEQLAALTQPASPALKLPDAFSLHDAKMFCAEHGVTGAYELASQMANYAIAEVKRLNAPHTAPIEPICATGGEEWVKVSERMPEHLKSVVISGPFLADRIGYWDVSHWDIEGCWYDRNDVTHYLEYKAAPEE